MQEKARAILLYDIQAFEPEMRQLAACILQCAQLVKDALPLLRRINAIGGELNNICEPIVHIWSRSRSKRSSSSSSSSA